nr:retrovirus-related Pol polyprotein from transposon TNT 1-94 [Tanacetum cinerariifolium]
MLFLVWSTGSTNPQNNAKDAAFDGKEHDFDVKKPESQVILSPCNNAQSKEHDNQTKKEAKEKSHVESVIGYRDLNAEFQDCSKNNSNEVTTASSTVPTVRQNSLNSTIPFWVEAVNTACYVQNRVLVTKPRNKTPYELLHGRTPSIGFMRPFGYPVTILNTLDSLGKFDEKNTDGDATFEVKEHEFKGRKHESKVHISPSSSAQKKKHDDKTKREAKGKSHVESSTGYGNLSADFKDFSDNSINEVNAADTSVPAGGRIFTNSTNIFSAVGPSNAAVSPTHGKSSYMDTSQLSDDPNMPALEDITYFDDEEDVDLLLPIPFWVEAVNTACYVQNRVLVTKPRNKTPYELLHGRTPSIGFMRPFGYPTVVANSTIEAEYVAASSCCGQVLWIHSQLLDYG